MLHAHLLFPRYLWCEQHTRVVCRRKGATETRPHIVSNTIVYIPRPPHRQTRQPVADRDQCLRLSRDRPRTPSARQDRMFPRRWCTRSRRGRARLFRCCTSAKIGFGCKTSHRQFFSNRLNRTGPMELVGAKPLSRENISGTRQNISYGSTTSSHSFNHTPFSTVLTAPLSIA